MNAILVLFHCDSNTGYAIERLESVFFEMSLALMGNDPSRIHFAYPGMSLGPSSSLPSTFNQYLILDSSDQSRSTIERAVSYIRRHQIDTLFGFDQPVSRPIYKHLRKAGIRTFVSYWGAPMSSIFGPLRRSLKRLEYRLRKHGPDHYIFESYGMARTATLGRGVPESRTSVVPLGVNTSTFQPSIEDAHYAYHLFNIPSERRIFVFSGHMEPRKGVHIILRAARELYQSRAKKDWHILLFGDPGPDLARLQGEIGCSAAASHVTFCGYRNDLARIHRGCYAGIIASTGWDSLTMSSIEMQSSGLPLLTSNLIGLSEAIVDGQTGFLFQAGDHVALAARMKELIDNPELRDRLSRNARTRVEREYSRSGQITRLVALMKSVTENS